MQPNKNQALLVVLAALLSIKFLLLPLMEWQDESIAALELTQQKLQRAEGLLAKKEALQAEQRLMQKQLEQALAGVPVVSDVQQIRIETLQKMQRLLEPSGVTVSLFDIASEQSLADTGVSAAILNIELKGKLPQLALAHFELEQQFPNLVVNQFRLSGGRMDGKRDITLVMMANYYFRTAAKAPKSAPAAKQGAKTS